MTQNDVCIPKDAVFDFTHKVTVGNKVYLISRHFTGHRDYIQAVFTAVANEAKRDDSVIQAG